MPSDRFFSPSLHKRLIEITDEVSEINTLIAATLEHLDSRPELAEEIRLLTLRCSLLVREAAEIRSRAEVSSANGGSSDPTRSTMSGGSGAQA